jgi:hypothetical protein
MQAVYQGLGWDENFASEVLAQRTGKSAEDGAVGGNVMALAFNFLAHVSCTAPVSWLASHCINVVYPLSIPFTTPGLRLPGFDIQSFTLYTVNL